ncbi:helix-turn-helix transcriptional regulator, partial [Clostridioides difficile]|nr:helix-turn-helix transcriptional regulator [Clostridioides difficile]
YYIIKKVAIKLLDIQINKLLENQNKTRYWLAKQIGMTHQNLTKLANNNTNSIKFDSLEKICMALKCSPNELFGWEQDK